MHENAVSVDNVDAEEDCDGVVAFSDVRIEMFLEDAHNLAISQITKKN